MKKNVVVIGGGVAGALLAKLLQNDAHVTLIDPRDAHNVDVTYSDQSYQCASPLDDTPAAASSGMFHNAIDPSLVDAYDKIKSSKAILIVGGGPTGVELAGEIATQFPDKKITLVNRGSRLLSFIGPKASQKSLEWLISKKVEVLLNQTVNLKSSSKDVYETSEGETIVADAYFTCTGKPLSSSWLNDTILKPCLNTDETLAVDTCLRVVGYKNVFAIGDITNVPELKQGYLAMEHATLTAKNIKLLFRGEDEEKLGAYKASKPLAFVSLGKKDGVAQINGFTIHGCLVGVIKSKDLFVGKTRKSFGLQS
ncbi:hypothetical protein KSS87_009822 [Heliosperma pusillum]|nr:hypothetical protein KSS87_009822 [Heliosperma pusillum]